MSPDATDAPDEGADRTRTGAQAVERAMAILRSFHADDDDLGISEIAARTGLRVSTAHRIVRALCGDGFMDQDRRTDRYRLGRTLVLLGQQAAAQLGLEAARPTLERLAETTGESASLGTRQGDEIVVVLVASSAQRLRFDHEQGGRIGLHASAMGKAVLANSTRDVARAVPEDMDLARFTDQTVVDREALLAELVTIRERGYAVNDQGRFEGVIGIAAPVMGRDGIARAAVGVQGPTSRLTPGQLPDVAAQVLAAAEELSALPVLDRL
jgi:IclR family transcriptional regulator, acetate operon repressor